MSDAIVRLRVESQEYDAKLKRAAEGLQRYADECRKVGGTLEVVEQETLDYVKALGQMDTVSRSATGSLAEMSKTYTEVAMQYKKLTDEEKNSPFGKAMAQSLDQLRGRIQESKVQLDEISKSLNGSSGLSGALDSIAGKFGLNIGQLTKFGSAVGIATAAINVAKDAFMQSESNIDEWGRTLKGAEGAYDLFLDTLNNGDWSNFFKNLETAIKGGRDLYNVFDRLKSIKNNNAAAIAIVRQQIQELRVAKQNGQDVDAQLKAANERLAMLQKQSVAAGKAAGNQAAFNVIRNGVNSVGGAPINDATINLAVSKIMNGGQGVFDAYRRNRDTLYQRGLVTRTQTINDSQGGTYERQYKVFDINALSKEQQKQYALAQAITEGESRIQEGIAAFASAVTEGAHNATEEFKGNRYRLYGSGHGGTGGTDNISKVGFDINRAGLAGTQGVDTMPSVWGMLDEKGRKQVIDTGAKAFDLGKDITEKDQKKLLGLSDMAKENAKSWEDAANAISSFGAALSNIEDPAAKVMGIVAQAVANIALTFSKSLAGTVTPWDWIAAAATGVTTMISTISAIHSATGYAQGGIVKGNSYSGDNIPAMVGGPNGEMVGLNAGEVVLTKAMAGNLASQLQGTGMRDMQLEAVVSGEQLRFILNSNGRRTGRGEFVTTNFR